MMAGWLAGRLIQSDKKLIRKSQRNTISTLIMIHTQPQTQPKNKHKMHETQSVPFSVEFQLIELLAMNE